MIFRGCGEGIKEDLSIKEEKDLGRRLKLRKLFRIFKLLKEKFCKKISIKFLKFRDQGLIRDLIREWQIRVLLKPLLGFLIGNL